MHDTYFMSFIGRRYSIRERCLYINYQWKAFNEMRGVCTLSLVETTKLCPIIEAISMVRVRCNRDMGRNLKAEKPRCLEIYPAHTADLNPADYDTPGRTSKLDE